MEVRTLFSWRILHGKIDNASYEIIDRVTFTYDVSNFKNTRMG